MFKTPYPVILGTDVAGTVEQVGEGVTKFSTGDKVMTSCTTRIFAEISEVWAWLPYLVKPHMKYGGFQKFSVADADVAAKIPEGFSFDECATIGLGMGTGSMGT